MATKIGRATLADLRQGRTLYHVARNAIRSAADAAEVFRIRTYRVLSGLQVSGGNKKYSRRIWCCDMLDENNELCSFGWQPGMTPLDGRGQPVLTMLFTSRKAAQRWLERYSTDTAMTAFEHPAQYKWARDLMLDHAGTLVINPIQLSRTYGTVFVSSYISKLNSGYKTRGLREEFQHRTGQTVFWGDLDLKAAMINADAQRMKEMANAN